MDTTSTDKMSIDKTTYEYAIYIGRFQPFHLGHLASLRAGLRAAKKVILIIGSVNRQRSKKNPWTFREREKMVRSSLNDEENYRLIIVGVSDIDNDKTWAARIKGNIDRITGYGKDNERPDDTIYKEYSIVVIGYMRDTSSYYLNMFKYWDYIELDEYQNINATKIRHVMFESDDIQSVTRPVAEQIQKYMKSDQFTKLIGV